MTQPVLLRVQPTERPERIHVVIRLLLLFALGTIGCSSVYWILYLTLPAVAALLIASHGAERFRAEDAPRLVRVLRWLAGAYAYLWLLTDELPSNDGNRRVELEVTCDEAPSAGAALLRLVYSVPAVLLLALLSIVASLLWIVGALMILARRRLPRAIAGFLELTLRYQFRLAAYHLSLVGSYPSFEHAPPAQLTHHGVA
jgi:hypothetical protein